MGKRRTSEPPANAFRVCQYEGHRPRFVDTQGTVYKEATDAFYDAVNAVFKGTEYDERQLTTEGHLAIRDILPNISLFYPHGASKIYVAEPEKREALNKLFLAFQAALQSAHHSGIERGKSLLVRLASGELTTSEFNQCALKKAEGEE